MRYKVSLVHYISRNMIVCQSVVFFSTCRVYLCNSNVYDLCLRLFRLVVLLKATIVDYYYNEVEYFLRYCSSNYLCSIYCGGTVENLSSNKMCFLILYIAINLSIGLYLVIT